MLIFMSVPRALTSGGHSGGNSHETTSDKATSKNKNQLFTNTEAGEDAPEQVIGGKLPGDFAQCLLCQPQFFGQQFPRVSAH